MTVPTSTNTFDWLNLFFGIVTLISLIFAIVSKVDSSQSKKRLKDYTYLFDIAKRNMDKSTTQEELDKIEAEFKNMKKAIKEGIPLEARKTVLKDRLIAEEEQITNIYKQYNQTKKQLEEMSVISTDMPKEISNAIETHIMPRYVIVQQRQKFFTILAIISYISAFLSAIPFFNTIGMVVMLFSVYPLFKIFGLYVPKDKIERRKYLTKLLLYFFLLICGLIVIIFTVLFFIPYGYFYNSPEALLVVLLSLAIFITLLIYLLRRRVKENKKQEHF